jgi:hypothetical protein
MREKGIEKKKSGRSPPFEGLRGVSEELKKKQRKEFEKEDVLEHLFSFFSFFLLQSLFLLNIGKGGRRKAECFYSVWWSYSLTLTGNSILHRSATRLVS